MRLSGIVLTAAVMLLLTGTSASAQRGSRGGGPPASAPANMPPPQASSPQRQGASQSGSTSRGSGSAPDKLLNQNTHLSSGLKELLPPNTNLDQASSGFKNLGQFVAAVHVSHNLDIPFDQLKAQVVGGKSLGEAVHDLKPTADAKAEAKKADRQAKQDLK